MSATYNVFAINPGSTSTKISLFKGEKEVFQENVEHDWRLLKEYGLFDQVELREKSIRDFLAARDAGTLELNAVVGRCGDLVRPVRCGVYQVNGEMLRDVRAANRGHASSLGIVLADRFARRFGVKAFAVNPTSVIEAWPLATISGLKGCLKDNHFHVLSHKEVGRRAAARLGRSYEECNFIIAHLGGGITVAAHYQGRAVDSTSAVKSTGPFSGRRAGGVRAFDILELCFSEGMTKEKMEDVLMKTGGLVSYLGTDDCQEIESRIAAGDEYAALVYEAMAYRIAKEIAMYAAPLKGQVDAVCLTGGMARSAMLTGWISQRVSFLAPVISFPGTLEMEAMNNGVQSVLRGQTDLSVY